MRAIATIEARPLPLSQLGERYRRYRLTDPASEEAMARSLSSYGQLAPVTACWRDGRAELLDGFKRHAAAARVQWPSLSVRLIEVDERSAKAAIFGLNHTGQHPSELEEAWIVQALVREDGLSQVEAAQLLNKHKSWVCRRLALLERLGVEAQAELRLGLLSPGLARQLTRLPVGNQAAVLAAMRFPDRSRSSRRRRSVARRVPGSGRPHIDGPTRGLAATGSRASPRSAFESGGQSTGPATGAGARRARADRDLAASSGSSRVEA